MHCWRGEALFLEGPLAFPFERTGDFRRCRRGRVAVVDNVEEEGGDDDFEEDDDGPEDEEKWADMEEVAAVERTCRCGLVHQHAVVTPGAPDMRPVREERDRAAPSPPTSLAFPPGIPGTALRAKRWPARRAAEAVASRTR